MNREQVSSAVPMNEIVHIHSLMDSCTQKPLLHPAQSQMWFSEMSRKHFLIQELIEETKGVTPMSDLLLLADWGLSQ